MLQALGRRAWLYVDDLLLLFRSAEHAPATALTIAFLSILKKAQVGHAATWCGWTFDFSVESLHLPAPKVQKLREQLARIAQSKAPKKEVGSRFGALDVGNYRTCGHI